MRRSTFSACTSCRCHEKSSLSDCLGAATSSYQIEGGVNEDGKGRTIWDDFVRQKGRIADGSTGDVACDHYHRFRQDVELMAELGVRSYRFSISWARILPDGTGCVEPRGLQFYSDLVDCLLEHGSQPAQGPRTRRAGAARGDPGCTRGIHRLRFRACACNE